MKQTLAQPPEAIAPVGARIAQRVLETPDFPPPLQAEIKRLSALVGLLFV